MTPRLSVLILTYNQKSLVAETLAGVLRQKTEEPFEIVVGDDCSTDGTAGLCEEILLGREHARVLRSDKNGGLIANFRRTLAACRGRYVALLGGDDIWIAEDKLARQLRAFDENPSCGVCYTGFARLIHETGELQTSQFNPPPQKPLRHLIEKGNFLCASTACFDRSRVTEEEWAEMIGFAMEDYPLWITLAVKSDFIGLPQTMVHYRVIKGSISRSHDPRKTVRFIECSRAVALHYAAKHFDACMVRRVQKLFDLSVFATYRNSGATELLREHLRALPLRRLLASSRLTKARLLTLFSKSRTGQGDVA